MPIATNLKQNKLLLDTHIWYWLVTGDTSLKKSFVKQAQRASDDKKLYISIFSTWEIAMLCTKKKIAVEIDIHDWINQSLDDQQIQVIPLSIKIAVQSSNLPVECHGDPADRILIASAYEENAVLVTADSKILEYGKGRHITAYNPLT